MEKLFLALFRTAILMYLFSVSTALHSISPSQPLSDSMTLVSHDGSFELGFFTPDVSKKQYYLGIWYRNIPVRTVVWVANQQNPLNDSSGLFMIDSSSNSSNLVILRNNGSVVWSSNSTKLASNPVAELLDSGNLILRDEGDGNSGDYLWQSFDYPSDTLLPGMKLGMNLKTGLDRRLTSWKNWDDPTPGDFVWKIKVHKYPESTMWKGSNIYFRTGPWNGISFSGTPHLKPNPIFYYEFVSTEEEIYYIYNLKQKSVISRVVINQTISRRERYTWDGKSQSWMLYTYVPIDSCDRYGLCGAYGNCIISNNPVCECLTGFRPKAPAKWNITDWSEGCTRTKPLNCQNGDGFKKFDGLKLPDTTYSWVNESMNLEECRAKCLENCSCTAYTNFDLRNGGSGCAIWFNDLVDIRQYPSGGQELFIRMSASELDAREETDKKIATLLVPAIAVAFSIIIVAYYFYRRRRRLADETEERSGAFQNVEDQNEDLELPVFDLMTIANATDLFSETNKLGEGGFGPVYKGRLVEGQEIAVKRLSRNSGQGLKEFKNEVILIAKLQHRNLVKLLGCCIQGEDKMLVYEYMPNKSLDYFIFDQTRRKLLDWPKRFNIICGIARGLLYLHQDSRLRIVHRDLKASNILLDKEMNPKISDFGMARSFGGDQTEGNTNRVVGTYGYMAPEYASDGLFSVKSDVFSFGILLLEIISGKKSRGFYQANHDHNLIGYAWRLWKEDQSLDMVDSVIAESWDLAEVTRCIQISLLCVQQHPEDRPSIASVVLMLGSEVALPQPKEPGFFRDISFPETDSTSSKQELFSTNPLSYSLPEAR